MLKAPVVIGSFTQARKVDDFIGDVHMPSLSKFIQTSFPLFKVSHLSILLLHIGM